MGWSVVEIPELRGYVVEWSEPGNYLLSRRNVVYRSSDLKVPFERIAEFPTSIWRKAVALSRLGQRLIRFSCNVVMPMFGVLQIMLHRFEYACTFLAGQWAFDAGGHTDGEDT